MCYNNINKGRREGIRSQKLRGNFPQSEGSFLISHLPFPHLPSILIWNPGNFESSFSPILLALELTSGWSHFNVIKEDYDPATLVALAQSYIRCRELLQYSEP